MYPKFKSRAVRAGQLCKPRLTAGLCCDWLQQCLITWTALSFPHALHAVTVQPNDVMFCDFGFTHSATAQKLWLGFCAACKCDWCVTCVCGSRHEHVNKWPWPPAGLALSLNDHEVKIYKRNGTKWQETDTLGEHGQRVTGIDWAPKSNRIVTCGAVSTLKLHATYMFTPSI